MTYDVQVKRSVLKTLNGLAKPIRQRLWARIRALADDPRPAGAKALQPPWKGHYRLRVGDLRILYTVDDGRRLVSVVGVGERERIYR